jgi:hypothetical protein
MLNLLSAMVSGDIVTTDIRPSFSLDLKELSNNIK